MTQNNYIKTKISLFYDKAELMIDSVNRKTCGIADADTINKKYVCALCYDGYNILVDVCVNSNKGTIYGCHINCKNILYCSHIFNEIKKTDSEYINNINMDILINIIKSNISDTENGFTELRYLYKSNCCCLNPTKYNTKNEAVRQLYGESFRADCVIEGTQDYILFFEEPRKKMFVFNRDYIVSDHKDALIMNVNKQSFIKYMLRTNDKSTHLMCSYSEQNLCHVCNDCICEANKYLIKNKYYIPIQYKKNDILIPVKTAYIVSLLKTNSPLIDYNCILFIIHTLKEYDFTIDISKIHYITLKDYVLATESNNTEIINKVVDNLYHMIYSFSFTYGLSNVRTYDFITALFIFMGKKRNNDIKFDSVASKTITEYVKSPPIYKKANNKNAIDIMEFYNANFKIITDYLNHKKKDFEDEQLFILEEKRIKERNLAREECLIRKDKQLFILEEKRIKERNLAREVCLIRNIKKNVLYELKNKICMYIESDYFFNESLITNYSTSTPYIILEDKTKRCLDSVLYLKLEKLKFCLLLHFTRDYENKNVGDYTKFTEQQTDFLIINKSLFQIEHKRYEKIEKEIDENIIDEAYKIFNLSNDFNLIKNLRANYKYPFYTFSYVIDKKSQYVKCCNVNLYYKGEYITPYHFIRNELKYRLLERNIFS